MAARPPEVEHSEGELHEPDDPQPEHPEQHAGADRPGGRLAHVAGPTAGVDPEGGEQGDLLEQPGDEEEALDAGGFLDEFPAEDGLRVEGREAQAGRERRPEEQRRAQEPDHRRDDDEKRPGQTTQPGATVLRGLWISSG